MKTKNLLKWFFQVQIETLTEAKYTETSCMIVFTKYNALRRKVKRFTKPTLLCL